MYASVANAECADIRKKKFMLGFLNNLLAACNLLKLKSSKKIRSLLNTHTACVESLLKFMK